MGLHDLIKLYKHGYSKVTDHVCREIRFGRLSREQGLALVQKHEQQSVDYQDQFCEWLGMKSKSLQFMLDLHRNPLYWKQAEVKQWKFQGASTHLNSCLSASSKVNIPELFSAQHSLSYDRDERYVTIGKGWP